MNLNLPSSARAENQKHTNNLREVQSMERSKNKELTFLRAIKSALKVPFRGERDAAGTKSRQAAWEESHFSRYGLGPPARADGGLLPSSLL